MKKNRSFYFWVISLSFFIVSLQNVHAESCDMREVKEVDLTIKDSEKIKLIIDSFKPLEDLGTDPPFQMIQVDINNDGQEEYIITHYGGSGRYLSFEVITKNGYKVPDTFWGTDENTKIDLNEIGNLPGDRLFIARMCDKNYLGFRTQSGALSLYYIDKKVTKACTPDWQSYFKTRPAYEGWSSFCQKSFTTIDPTKKREDLIGYFSVNDACSGIDINSDTLLLNPGVSEVILTPYGTQDLNVKIIWGEFWSSTKEPGISTYNATAIYEPYRGYRIQQPLTHNTGRPFERSQAVYIVPEKDRLVLEVLELGRLNNYSWTYDQRKKIPKTCVYFNNNQKGL